MVCTAAPELWLTGDRFTNLRYQPRARRNLSSPMPRCNTQCEKSLNVSILPQNRFTAAEKADENPRGAQRRHRSYGTFPPARGPLAARPGHPAAADAARAERWSHLDPSSSRVARGTPYLIYVLCRASRFPGTRAATGAPATIHRDAGAPSPAPEHGLARPVPPGPLGPLGRPGPPCIDGHRARSADRRLEPPRRGWQPDHRRIRSEHWGEEPGERARSGPRARPVRTGDGRPGASGVRAETCLVPASPRHWRRLDSCPPYNVYKEYRNAFSCNGCLRNAYGITLETGPNGARRQGLTRTGGATSEHEDLETGRRSARGRRSGHDFLGP